MVDSAAQVRRVVGFLRADGFDVVEVPGWERRGKAPMTTRGRVEHHTASRAVGEAPTLRVVTFGHGTLKNSLCRWYVSRSGATIYLVALNTSWHAGRGVKGTNGTLSGTEAEHSGMAYEPWTAGSLSAQAAISRYEAAVFGFSVGQVWEHKEHAPGRKVDRVDMNGAAWRRRLAAPKTVKPAVVAVEEDVLAKLSDEAQEFYESMFKHLSANDARPTSLGNVLLWFRKVRDTFK